MVPFSALHRAPRGRSIDARPAPGRQIPGSVRLGCGWLVLGCLFASATGRAGPEAPLARIVLGEFAPVPAGETQGTLSLPVRVSFDRLKGIPVLVRCELHSDGTPVGKPEVFRRVPDATYWLRQPFVCTVGPEEVRRLSGSSTSLELVVSVRMENPPGQLLGSKRMALPARLFGSSASQAPQAPGPAAPAPTAPGLAIRPPIHVMAMLTRVDPAYPSAQGLQVAVTVTYRIGNAKGRLIQATADLQRGGRPIAARSVLPIRPTTGSTAWCDYVFLFDRASLLGSLGAGPHSLEAVVRFFDAQAPHVELNPMRKAFLLGGPAGLDIAAARYQEFDGYPIVDSTPDPALGVLVRRHLSRAVQDSAQGRPEQALPRLRALLKVAEKARWRKRPLDPDLLNQIEKAHTRALDQLLSRDIEPLARQGKLVEATTAADRLLSNLTPAHPLVARRDVLSAPLRDRHLKLAEQCTAAPGARLLHSGLAWLLGTQGDAAFEQVHAQRVAARQYFEERTQIEAKIRTDGVSCMDIGTPFKNYFEDSDPVARKVPRPMTIVFSRCERRDLARNRSSRQVLVVEENWVPVPELRRVCEKEVREESYCLDRDAFTGVCKQRNALFAPFHERVETTTCTYQETGRIEYKRRLTDRYEQRDQMENGRYFHIEGKVQIPWQGQVLSSPFAVRLDYWPSRGRPFDPRAAEEEIVRQVAKEAGLAARDLLPTIQAAVVRQIAPGASSPLCLKEHALVTLALHVQNLYPNPDHVAQLQYYIETTYGFGAPYVNRALERNLYRLENKYQWFRSPNPEPPLYPAALDPL